MVDADPIRMFLFQWMIETGDSEEVVARGFGLESAQVAALLARDTRWLGVSEDHHLRAALGLEHACADNPSDSSPRP